MSANNVKSGKGIWGRVTIGLLFVITLLWLSDPATYEQEKSEEKVSTLKVTTIKVRPQPHQVDVDIVGTVQPRWPLTVVAAVSGRVEQFPTDLEPGDIVAKDGLLLSINDAAYRAEVAGAMARIKQAELEVARIKREKHIAENTSSQVKVSSYGRFEPHLSSAKAQLAAAQSSKSHAEQQLSETQIVAPFDAVVLQKQVVPGQWINAGDSLFMLAASESVDIHGELSNEQLKQLQGLSIDTKVVVANQSGVQFDAKLRFVDPYLSNSTRQSKVVFYVEQPYQNGALLKPNSMVSITIKGAEIDHVVSAPSSVLTPDGDVWLVENGKLVKHAIEVQQEFADKVFFKFSDGSDAERELVRFPTSSMIAEQAVVTELQSNSMTQYVDNNGDVL